MSTVGRSVALPARIAALAALPADGALPERTVLVRSEAVAHCWRRDLAAAGRAELLVGTRFTTALAAAAATLARAGVAYTPGEEALRAARIEALLHAEPPLALEAFTLDVLRRRPGWAAALAATLGELEGARVTPARLRAAGGARAADLAHLLERVDAAAGASWASARGLREAAAALARDPGAWPYGMPCLAEVTGHEPAALAAFVRAIPRIALLLPPARPRRAAHAERVAAVLGPAAVAAPATAAPPAGAPERDLLAAYLFADPDTLLDPRRPRSAGPDGTVHLEEHAGVDEELDAAVAWVVDEIGAHGTPLEQLAIVVPRLDPYAGLLADRLAEILPDGVHVAGALPATALAGGARLLAVLVALHGGLPAYALADVLPALRLDAPAAPPPGAGHVDVSRRAALQIASSLGTTGGSEHHLAGALAWWPGVARARAALPARLAALPEGDEDVAREREHVVKLLAQLTALAPALRALDAAARAMVEDAPLSALWPAVRAVLADHVRAGKDGPRLVAALDEALRPARAADLLRGRAALGAIARTLRALRLPLGRFGEPRVTIVALADAAGLTFTSVRVLGLAEGVVPSTGREDAVLPDEVRARVDVAIPRAALRVVGQLHALAWLIDGTTARIALSMARRDLDRGYREPSGVLLEAAAALGRPVAGAPPAAIPNDAALRAAYFEPARAHLAAARQRWPVRARAALERAAEARAVPAAWHADPLRALDRLAPADGDAPTPMDGWLPAGALPALPGLDPAHPLSASAAKLLLECPHRFLYERVLGWHPPSELADDGAIDALSYGSLFHAIAEAFYEAHGAAFTRQTHDLAHWQEIARALAEAQLEDFLATYPLGSAAIVEAQRARLLADVRALLEHDWAPKTFVGVEKAFGPVRLRVGGEDVHVGGVIDRLDVVGGTTLVRDLKTGRPHPRLGGEAALDPALDVQLGLYGLVARAQAQAWGLPRRIQGAYVYPAQGSPDERAYDEAAFEELATATEGWLETGVRLLRSHTFPRTPRERDCAYCGFRVVCGAHTERVTRLLARPGDAPAAAFAALKAGPAEEDEA